MLGCTPGNYPPGTTTLVINATTHNFAHVAGITGSDEVWFNVGDRQYYTGSSGATKPAGSPLGRGSVLGVIDGTSVLIETIPQSSGSHSVAADSKRNLIFVPTSSPISVPLGGQNTTAGSGSPTVGQLICGSTNGCIAVYSTRSKTKTKRERRTTSSDTAEASPTRVGRLYETSDSVRLMGTSPLGHTIHGPLRQRASLA